MILFKCCAPAKLLCCLCKLSTYNSGSVCTAHVGVLYHNMAWYQSKKPLVVCYTICQPVQNCASKMDFKSMCCCYAESRVPCLRRRRRRERGKVMLYLRWWRVMTQPLSARSPQAVRKAPTLWITLWVLLNRSSSGLRVSNSIIPSFLKEIKTTVERKHG